MMVSVMGEGLTLVHDGGEFSIGGNGRQLATNQKSVKTYRSREDRFVSAFGRHAIPVKVGQGQNGVHRRCETGDETDVVHPNGEKPLQVFAGSRYAVVGKC